MKHTTNGDHFLFGAAFLAAGFLAAGFLVAAFLAAGFLAAVVFLAATFLAGLAFVIFLVFLAADLTGEATGDGVAAVAVGATGATGATVVFFGVVTFLVGLAGDFLGDLVAVFLVTD